MWHLAPFKVLLSPMKWAYMLFANQTGVFIITPGESLESDGVFRVCGNGGNTGIALFGIATRKGSCVEIVKIDIDYAAPLQLADPGKRGYFDIATTPDLTWPYRLSWKGSEVIDRKLQQAFAFSATFSETLPEAPVRISVYARTQTRSLGGFVNVGPIQVTEFKFRLTLTQYKDGLLIAPECAMKCSQPFMAEGSWFGKGGPTETIIHETMKDGTISTTRAVIGQESKEGKL